MKTWLLLGVLFHLGCATGPRPSPPAPTFARFVDEVFDSRFRFRPSRGTADGFHQFDGALEDFSRQRLLARGQELKAELQRLAAFDRAKLTFDEQIDADILEGTLRAELLDLETLRYFQTNPMGYAGLPGNAVDGLIKRDFAPAAERLQRVIARLEAVPRVYQAARENLERPPREFTDLALRMSKGSIHFFESSLPTWVSTLGADPAQRARFDTANTRVIAETRRFAEWLERDLLPRSDGRYAIGEASFRAKLKYEELIETPLAELLARGQAQLAKDHAAFVATAKKIDPTKTPAEVMAMLSLDHPTAEDLIPSVARSVEEARRFVIDHQIITLPEGQPLRVEETPPYDRSGTFASLDSPGAYEDPRASRAFYYVTPVEKDWDPTHREEHLRLYNKYVVASINVHEAYPGHFVQFLYAPRFPSKTRKLLGSSTNAEGWAHYAEQMMIEQGFGGGDPKYRLAQLQEALLRDCRFVVGILLHTQGMSVEEGTRLFMEKGFQERANAFEEARRGAYNPTYLYYTLGKLEILQLAEEYRAQTGASLREFHDAFVAQGYAPIPLVRRILFDRKAAR